MVPALASAMHAVAIMRGDAGGMELLPATTFKAWVVQLHAGGVWAYACLHSSTMYHSWRTVWGRIGEALQL